MDIDTRSSLREGIEWVIRFAASPGTTVGHDVSEFDAYVTANNYQSAGPLPPLTTVQQLALSALIGEPDTVIAMALAEHLIDQGHEYATAVAEKARAEERERVLRGIDKRIATWAAVMREADTAGRERQSLGCSARISELQVVGDLLRENA